MKATLITDFDETPIELIDRKLNLLDAPYSLIENSTEQQYKRVMDEIQYFLTEFGIPDAGLWIETAMGVTWTIV